ncbi:2,3-bisphosphoglycerate-independent phosphoglycerate mutase [Clarias magur]|uniref:2,3-bisphosphoglycerate-independent phosphoglycerate mutase n=1 Tax=Clarias magur TaxID=1594786 RepID=A0A8J4XD27_CLAMG|nr:2,3-bisphosphoglycerate-independent phosphoglycerate mutase [Clarias magur]
MIHKRMRLACFSSQLATNTLLLIKIIKHTDLKTFAYPIKPDRSVFEQDSVLPRFSGAQAAEGQVETKTVATFYLMPNPWGGSSTAGLSGRFLRDGDGKKGKQTGALAQSPIAWQKAPSATLSSGSSGLSRRERLNRPKRADRVIRLRATVKGSQPALPCSNRYYSTTRHTRFARRNSVLITCKSLGLFSLSSSVDDKLPALMTVCRQALVYPAMKVEIDI